MHLISFPFWLDTWWALRHIDAMLVDGHTVTQLYNMRSEKEERLAGGFPPEEEGMSLASALQGGDGRPDPTPARATVGGGGGGGLGGLGGGRGAGARELEQKLAEADLDRTLCKNRIAQLEEELERTSSWSSARTGASGWGSTAGPATGGRAALDATGQRHALARCMRGERLWALTREPPPAAAAAGEAARWRVDTVSEQIRPESMEV